MFSSSWMQERGSADSRTGLGDEEMAVLRPQVTMTPDRAQLDGDFYLLFESPWLPWNETHSLWDRSLLFLLCQQSNRDVLALAQNLVLVIGLALVMQTEDRTELLISSVLESDDWK